VLILGRIYFSNGIEGPIWRVDKCQGVFYELGFAKLAEQGGTQSLGSYAGAIGEEKYLSNSLLSHKCSRLWKPLLAAKSRRLSFRLLNKLSLAGSGPYHWQHGGKNNR